MTPSSGQVLSVVMPVYNEQETLEAIVRRVREVPLKIELLCVDDGSTDRSREILARLEAEQGFDAAEKWRLKSGFRRPEPEEGTN